MHSFGMKINRKDWVNGLLPLLVISRSPLIAVVAYAGRASGVAYQQPAGKALMTLVCL